MAQERQETREEEVARVRSYLASQSMRRKPEQIAEALREAYQQFLTALATIPDAAFHTLPKEEEWSAADVLVHVHRITVLQERSISGVIERGEQPTQLDDVVELAPMNATREQLLEDTEAHLQRLITVVLHADPLIHLDTVWAHSEFGTMNWREWLLFARVHTLDHAHQIQSIAAVVTASQP